MASMEKQKITMIIGKPAGEAVAALIGDDEIEGSLENYAPEQLIEHVKTCKAGLLFTRLNGRLYEFTELSISGDFKMKRAKD